MSLTEATPTLEDLRALDLQSIEATPFADCSRYAKALLASKSMPPRGSAGWKAHLLVGFVASLRLDPDKADAPLELGGWSFPETGPDCLTADQVAVLAQWLRDVTDPDLRARVAECLWLVRKPRDHEAGRTAVESYVDAASRLAGPDCHWPDAIDRFARAYQLAANFQMKERVTAAVEAALDDPADVAFGPRKVTLMRLLQDHRESDAAKYAPIAESLAQRGESEAVGEPPGTSKLWIAGDYWRAAANWRARELGPDHETVRGLRVRGAEIHVLLADKSRDVGDPMVEAHHLGHAVTALRKANAPKARVDEVIARMMTAQRSAPMATFSTSIEVTRQLREGQKHVAGKDLRLALLHLAQVTSPPKLAELRELVDSYNEHFVAHRLLPMTLTTSDHRIAKHMPALSDREDTEEQKENNRAVIRWQMWREAEHARVIATGYIEGARMQVLLEHNPRVADLIPLVDASCLVPPGHEGLFGRGLHAGLHGDFAVACHILVPQFENGLRVFAQESLGKTIVSIEKDGTQMAGLLKRLLALPELAAVLGQDMIFDLQGLLVMQESVNLRNNLSHGFLHDRSIGVAAIYFWWLCLRICVLLVPAPAPEEPS
jgi:hypothetical protein